MTTPRELVYQTLNLQNPARIPYQLWVLPWAASRYPDTLARLQNDFPDDIVGAGHLRPEGKLTSGDPYIPGESVDAWGCRRVNIHPGIIGEIKEPLIRGAEWEDRARFYIPEETLDFDLVPTNEFCRSTDKFVATGGFTIFERMQHLRGSEQFMLDLAYHPKGMFEVLEQVHAYNCRMAEKLCQCDIDALMWSDDWGAQQNLLIHPRTWVKIFKPLYQDYIDIARKYGKKTFMHSDGHILAILPHLIDMGLDAINSQIFCMGLDKLRQFRGKITFWGEIDRQYLLPFGSLDEVSRAVEQVKDQLWVGGGCIAQCDFGVGVKAENVYQVFATWQRIMKN